MDTSRPFRTRDAALAGAPTRGTLAGPGFRSPFRGTHVAAGADDDLVTRAHAAALLVEGGVVGGYAAAALHGADCAPRGAPVDLVVGPAGSGTAAVCAYARTSCEPTRSRSSAASR